MTVTFVGDVHGWSGRLDRILTQVSGHAVFLGDLVDRGPDAPGVLARVRDLCEAGRATCVLGNHEYGMLRSVGCPDLGLDPDPAFAPHWIQGFGGFAVLQGYGVSDIDGLRAALGSHVRWLAGLPWVAEGAVDGRQWIAVHAGLEGGMPVDDQLSMLRRGWACCEVNLPAIFAKSRAQVVPRDLPPDTVLVSGHTPVPAALVTETRILCDTSGGLARRRLSGVVWPEGRVVRS